MEDSLARFFDRESRIDRRDRERARARVKALEVNRGFFSTLTSEIKAGRASRWLLTRGGHKAFIPTFRCASLCGRDSFRIYRPARIRKERAREASPCGRR